MEFNAAGRRDRAAGLVEDADSALQVVYGDSNGFELFDVSQAETWSIVEPGTTVDRLGHERPGPLGRIVAGRLIPLGMVVRTSACPSPGGRFAFLGTEFVG